MTQGIILTATTEGQVNKVVHVLVISFTVAEHALAFSREQMVELLVSWEAYA